MILAVPAQVLSLPLPPPFFPRRFVAWEKGRQSFQFTTEPENPFSRGTEIGNLSMRNDGYPGTEMYGIPRSGTPLTLRRIQTASRPPRLVQSPMKNGTQESMPPHPLVPE